MCGNCVELCPMDVLAMGDWGPEVAYTPMSAGIVEAAG